MVNFLKDKGFRKRGIHVMRKVHEKCIYSMKNVWLKSLGLMVVLVFMVSSSGHAIWLGQSQVNPYLELQGVYESNVFRVSDDSEKESDFITVISPGVHMEFPTAQDSLYRLIANYRANIKFYTNDGDSEIDPDGELNTFEHRLDGRAELNFAAGLSMIGGYILNIASIPPDFAGDTRNKYKEHGLLAQVGYKFVDRYEVQMGYNGTFRRFDEDVDQNDDFTIHDLEATFFYKLFPSFSLLGGGGYALVNREEPIFSDSTEYRGFGGVRFEATERLTGILKAGVVNKDFDAGGFDDTTNAFVSGELAAQFSEDTKVSLLAQRDIEETSVSNESVDSGAYYVSTGLWATLNHTLAALPNLSLSGSLSYQQESYPEDVDDRSDNNFEVGVGAEYKFLKYVGVGLDYQYSQTDSNIDANDYSDNIVTLSIKGIL
jgi:opacity protein-like surface antigen